jgi:flagellar motor switch/type III secretory pathway protein FliN
VNPQPFDLGSCPRVRARQARATRAALRTCALLPERWPVELPPLGSATMSFAGFDSQPDRTDAGVELVVKFGTGRGRVIIDAAFAARLVDTVLGGGPVFSVGRAVGPVERGILAGVLAPVFDRIGGSVLIGPVTARDAADRGSASISFRLQTAVASGWLRLMPPAIELSASPDALDVWRARASRVPFTGRIEIAATLVPAGAFVGVAVGDAIVFDGARSSEFAADGLWNGRLRLGSHVAEIAIDVGGKLSMVGGFSPLQKEETIMSASGSNTDATTVLAAASIEVVAELGRIMLRGDELLGLAPGAVLAVGAGRTNISLRVGGEIWADGEIVDVDGELGVRVTRIANR